MNFEDVPNDQLAAWIADPVTQAFIGWLREHEKNARNDVVSSVSVNGPTGDSQRYVGQMQAYGKAAEAASRVE